MANSIQATIGLLIDDALGAKQLRNTLSYTPAGNQYFLAKQIVGTATETLAIADCATLRYAALANPTGSGGTVTVTTAALVLKPGDVAIFPPAATAVTLQATGAAIEINAAGAEA